MVLGAGGAKNGAELRREETMIVESEGGEGEGECMCRGCSLHSRLISTCAELYRFQLSLRSHYLVRHADQRLVTWSQEPQIHTSWVLAGLPYTTTSVAKYGGYPHPSRTTGAKMASSGIPKIIRIAIIVATGLGVIDRKLREQGLYHVMISTIECQSRSGYV